MTEHLLGFIAMAIAILAILTVGTLIAADIIHLGRRRTVPVPVPEAERRTQRPTERSDPAPAPPRHGRREDRHPSNAA